MKSVSNNHLVKAFCKLCKREFLISHGGENDLTQHAETDMHKKNELAKGGSNIGTFFKPEGDDSVAVSEASYVYHAVKHGISYNSTDCLVKLNGTLFHDSSTVKKINLGI